MKISHKLILVIFINLIAIIGLGTVSYVGIQTINARFDDLVRFPIPSILRLSNMTEALILSVEEAHSYRLYGFPGDKEQYYKSNAEFNRLLGELKKELHYGTPEIPSEDVELIDAITTETAALHGAVVADFANDEATQGLDKTGVDPFSEQKEKIVALLRQYRDMEQDEITFAHKEVNTTTEEMIFIILAAALLILILNLAINGLIAKSIITPLGQLWETARELGIGDLSKRVTITNNDELGALGAAFNIMADNFQRSRASLESQIAERTTELEKLKAEPLKSSAPAQGETTVTEKTVNTEPVEPAIPPAAQTPPQETPSS